MSAESTISLGLPVEIGQIDKALGRLWEESGDTKTRASHINLAIHTHCPDSLIHNTELIAQLARDHACRAILILSRPDASTSEARAWISAHCHVHGKSDRQVCSEQITFQLDGEMASALPNIVFSHLDSDLPLYFWWQGEFPEDCNERLWNWVDRLIFDSATWKNPAAQFKILTRIPSAANRRLVLCDLNWARLLPVRFALAQIFDHSAALSELSRIRRISITHAPDSTVAAQLLLGWLGGQMGWKIAPLLDRHAFQTVHGSEIEFTLTAKPGASLSACLIESDQASFELRREEASEFFHVRMNLPGGVFVERTLPAGRDRTIDVLLGEIGRGGRHKLYLKALSVLQPLLYGHDV